MYNAGKILPGLGLFLGLVTYPIWASLGSGQDLRAPKIEKPTKATRCILDAGTMRRDHMRLLASWRDEVVRTGQRRYIGTDGRRFDKSLTGTCLDCHENKAASCDRCHQYLHVNPYCWDCHVDPKGGR